MNKKQTTAEFKKGDKVEYVPSHADGNLEHEDCECGIVSSVNEENGFVNYKMATLILTTGEEPYT